MKKKKKRKSKAEDESKALQLVEEATEPDAMPKVLQLVPATPGVHIMHQPTDAYADICCTCCLLAYCANSCNGSWRSGAAGMTALCRLRSGMCTSRF